MEAFNHQKKLSDLFLIDFPGPLSNKCIFFPSKYTDHSAFSSLALINNKAFFKEGSNMYNYTVTLYSIQETNEIFVFTCMRLFLLNVEDRLE